jgi:hypothetical protein
MRSRDGGTTHNSWRESGIVDLWAESRDDDVPYSYTENSADYYPHVHSSNYTSLRHYDFGETGRLSWINYVRPFEEKYRDLRGQSPLIAFIQGVKTDGGA